jgi:hypothetical protein
MAFDTDAWRALPPKGSRWRRISPSGWCGRASPFRVAHEVAGACVRACEDARHRAVGPERRRPRRDLPAPDPGGARGAVGRGVAGLARRLRGGTAPVRVAEQLERVRCDGRRPGRRCGARAVRRCADGFRAAPEGRTLRGCPRSSRLPVAASSRATCSSVAPATCWAASGSPVPGCHACALTEVEAYAGEKGGSRARTPSAARLAADRR